MSHQAVTVAMNNGGGRCRGSGQRWRLAGQGPRLILRQPACTEQPKPRRTAEANDLWPDCPPALSFLAYDAAASRFDEFVDLVMSRATRAVQG